MTSNVFTEYFVKAYPDGTERLKRVEELAVRLCPLCDHLDDGALACPWCNGLERLAQADLTDKVKATLHGDM